MSGKNVGYRL